MDISSISGISKAADGSISDLTDTKTIGKEDFMTLLLKQLRYQDPLSPMDSTEFTSQLTQFSSLEQLSNMSKTLEDVLAFQQSMQNATVTNLIGRNIKISGDTIQLSGTAEMRYELLKDAESVVVSIFDSAGRLVSTEQIGAQSAGGQTYEWNGRNDDGSQLPDGTYTFEIKAKDNSGDPVESKTKTIGTVTGISFKDGATYIVLEGGRKVHLSEIQEIEERRT